MRLVTIGLRMRNATTNMPELKPERQNNMLSGENVPSATESFRLRGVGLQSALVQGESTDLGELRAALLGWYAQHKRELPWRQDTDAYRVWVSEVMLQQTRVAAVLEHYRVFLDTLPTLEALASAPEQQVLALWSGLGYYRRARMLHRAAQFVVSELAGVMPRDSLALRKLPGVGRYTASALASICFGEAVAVVDGNVERVLSRVDGEPRAEASAWKRAQDLLDPRHPGDWNQAMMELGATVCTPQNPQCLICPIHAWCRAPGAETSKPRAACKRVKMTRALIERKQCVYLVQRPADAGKMAGMWELPESAALFKDRPAQQRANQPVDQNAHQDAVQNAAQSEDRGAKELCVVRHSITDTNYEVQVVSLGLKALRARDKKAGRWVPREEISELPLTGLTRKILRKQGWR